MWSAGPIVTVTLRTHNTKHDNFADFLNTFQTYLSFSCVSASDVDSIGCNCYAEDMNLPHCLFSVSLPISVTLAGCASTHEHRVELTHHDGKYTLLAEGEPYIIHGVGGVDNLELLKEYGGNTIRTWDAEGIGDLLDHAHGLGIRVVAGIWLEHQRHGLDYDDPDQRREQLERVRSLVLEHRDHPALLAWGIGNEVELGGELDVAIRQINDAAAIVRKLDPNHPRMAVVAEIGDDKAIRIQNECPDIDFIGINAYGGLASIPDRLEKQGYTGAWTATEWGVLGHWESGQTPWGAPYEPTSSQKADFLRDVYDAAIQPTLGESCLGSFAFLWGHKQEKTATWYGLLLPTGETTERVDVLSAYWTGTAPSNLAPRVKGIELSDVNPHGIRPGEDIRVQVITRDPDGDDLDVEWSVVPESSVESMGGDFEAAIEAADVRIEQTGALNARIQAPSQDGAYRVFVTVRDGQGHAGTANVPIFVGNRSMDQ